MSTQDELLITTDARSGLSGFWRRVGQRRGPAGPPATDRRSGRRSRFDLILDLGIYIALAGMVLYFSLASPYFLTARNLFAVGTAVSITGILAVGLTIALIAGQLDLSIGANLALTSVIVAIATQQAKLPLVVALLLGLLVGLAVAALNIVLVVVVQINSLIVTIATGIAVRGVALILANGQVLPINDPTLSDIVTSSVAGIPVLVGLLIVIFVIAGVYLSSTRAGWHLYATGGNAVASLRSGINVRRVYTTVFITTALLASLCGVITAGTSQSGGPAYANGAEFDVLTAVLLGGIGLAGGSGRIQRTLAGVIVIGVLNNGLTLLSVDTYYQQLARGAALVLAVVLGAISDRKRAR